MISNESHLGLLKLIFSNEENKMGRLYVHLLNPENIGGLTLSFYDEKPYTNNNFQRAEYSMQGSSIFNKPITPEDCMNPLALNPRDLSITASGKGYISSTLGNLIPSWIQKGKGYTITSSEVSWLPDSAVLFGIFNHEKKQGIYRRRYFKKRPNLIKDWRNIQEYCASQGIEIH